MCLLYISHPNNCKLTAKYVSAAKPATKVLAKLVAAAISVTCSCTIFLHSQSICLLQITQYREYPV